MFGNFDKDAWLKEWESLSTQVNPGIEFFTGVKHDQFDRVVERGVLNGGDVVDDFVNKCDDDVIRVINNRFKFVNIKPTPSVLLYMHSLLGENGSFGTITLLVSYVKFKFMNVDNVTYEDIFSIFNKTPTDTGFRNLWYSQKVGDKVRDDSLLSDNYLDHPEVFNIK